MMVAIVGLDGAGKSTQVAAVGARFRQAGISVKTLDKWAILDRDLQPECRFIRTPLDDLRRCIAEMPSPARALFLLWSIAETHRSEHRDQADLTLLDGYWHKHVASEIALGCGEEWLSLVAAQLPPADVVLFLDVDPEAVLRRGKELTPYECGCDPTVSHESFLAHQRRVARVLRRWAASEGWTQFDAAWSPDELTAALADAIAARMKEGAAST